MIFKKNLHQIVIVHYYPIRRSTPTSSPADQAFLKQVKAPKLVTPFDETLKAMRQDGTYDKMIQSYVK
jgi:ABC-type amino acid transport substrate-binding protein